MRIEKADIVLSTAGHDKGKLFFAVEADEKHCLVANGKTGREIDKPKRKSVKHLQFIARHDCETAAKLKSGRAAENCELRRDLAKFGESRQNQGGK